MNPFLSYLAALGSERVNTRYPAIIPALTRALRYYLEHKTTSHEAREEIEFSEKKSSALPALAKALAELVNENTEPTVIDDAYTWWKMATKYSHSIAPTKISEYLARMKAGLE